MWSYPSPRRAGYSCKAWLAAEFARLYFAGVHCNWFASELNPVDNDPSSNPLRIYQRIDEAVKSGDLNDSKIEDLRAKLINVAWCKLENTDPQRAALLVQEIESAPLAMFRPQLLRIAVDKISASRYTVLNTQMDEHLVADLAEAEFEVIAD